MTLLGIGSLFLSMSTEYAEQTFSLLFGEPLAVSSGDAPAHGGYRCRLHLDGGLAVPAAPAFFSRPGTGRQFKASARAASSCCSSWRWGR